MIDIPYFGRCCFCLPLRRGVITFGYINLIWSAFLILAITQSPPNPLILYHGTFHEWGKSGGITCNVIDIIVTLILVTGGHMKWIISLKIFYFYTCATLLAVFVVQLFDIFSSHSYFFEIVELGLFIISAIIHFYILLLVKSLIKKLESVTAEEGYENQMQQIGIPQVKAEDNVSSTDVTVQIE